VSREKDLGQHHEEYGNEFLYSISYSPHVLSQETLSTGIQLYCNSSIERSNIPQGSPTPSPSRTIQLLFQLSTNFQTTLMGSARLKTSLVHRPWPRRSYYLDGINKNSLSVFNFPCFSNGVYPIFHPNFYRFNYQVIPCPAFLAASSPVYFPFNYAGE